MGEGDVAQAHDRMQRAEAIIDELLRTLDKSAGQVAERLAGDLRLLQAPHDGGAPGARRRRSSTKSARSWASCATRGPSSPRRGATGMSAVLQAAAELVAIAEQGCVLAAEAPTRRPRRAAGVLDRAVALLGPLTALPAAAKPLVARRSAAGRAGRHPRRRTGRGRGASWAGCARRAAARRATRRRHAGSRVHAQRLRLTGVETRSRTVHPSDDHVGRTDLKDEGGTPPKDGQGPHSHGPVRHHPDSRSSAAMRGASARQALLAAQPRQREHARLPAQGRRLPRRPALARSPDGEPRGRERSSIADRHRHRAPRCAPTATASTPTRGVGRAGRRTALEYEALVSVASTRNEHPPAPRWASR